MSISNRTINFNENISWADFENKIGEIQEIASSGEVKIQLENIQNFDPSFLGWLFLFSKERKCKVQIEFKSKENYLKYYEMLRQLSLLSQLKGNLVTVVSPSYKKKETLSEVFFPIFPVEAYWHEALYKKPFNLFVKGIMDVMKQDQFWRRFKGDRNNPDDIHKHIKEMITTAYTDTESKFIYIFLNYYLKLLKELHYFRRFSEIITEKCSDELKIKDQARKTRIQGFNEEKTIEYWKELVAFLEERICSKPPFFVVLFSLMVLNYPIKPSLNISTEGDLFKLYLLSYEYFTRLLELVDNILEHSSNKTGVIISRIFKKNKIETIYPDLHNYFENDQLKDVRNLLSITVMDVSKTGIISTSLSDWYSLKDPVFIDDASTLENKKSLRTFFDIGEIQFKHQTIRTCACLGLLMFTELIQRNIGYFEVDTKDASVKQGNKLFFCLNKFKEKRYSSNYYGTKYNIILPVDIKYVEPLSLHDELFLVPKAKTAMEALVKGKIFFVDTGNEVSIPSEAETVIWNTRVNFEYKYDKKRELEVTEAQRLVDGYKACSGKKRIVLCLNCENLQSDSIGSLFRIIAHIQLKHSHKAIIIYNLAEEDIASFVRLLLNYKRRGLWSDNHFILAINKFAEPFFIGGKNIEEWWCLNSFLKTHYGASDALLKMIEEKLGNPLSEIDAKRLFKQLAARNPLFIFDEREDACALLPIELFIKGANGYTMFESRVRNILAKRIPERITM